jgi:hypothetical protein
MNKAECVVGDCTGRRNYKIKDKGVMTLSRVFYHFTAKMQKRDRG